MNIHTFLDLQKEEIALAEAQIKQDLHDAKQHGVTSYASRIVRNEAEISVRKRALLAVARCADNGVDFAEDWCYQFVRKAQGLSAGFTDRAYELERKHEVEFYARVYSEWMGWK